MLIALLEYLDLLTHVAESGLANARPAGLRAPALPKIMNIGYNHLKYVLAVYYIDFFREPVSEQ